MSNDRRWTCGLEFDYANEESFYCRPLRVSDGKAPDRMPIPEQAGDARIAFLPPMSGLAATETRLDGGAVNVRIGEGRTAEVLRNLCLEVHDQGIIAMGPTGRSRSRACSAPGSIPRGTSPLAARLS